MGITTFQIPRDRYGREAEFHVIFANAIRQLFQGNDVDVPRVLPAIAPHAKK